MKESTDKKNVENDQEEHYCIFQWLGLFLGPAFIQTDKNGKVLNGIAQINEPLTQAFRDKLGASANFNDEQYGKAANKFAADNGWTVVKNEYLKSDYGFFKNLLEMEGSNITAKEIREKMAAGVVHFKYKKVDKPAKVNKKTGEVTPAVPGPVVERFGTLNQDLIGKTLGQVEKAQAKKHIPNENVIVYFDIHAENSKTGIAGDWRCFRLDNFQGFVD